MLSAGEGRHPRQRELHGRRLGGGRCGHTLGKQTPTLAETEEREGLGVGSGTSTVRASLGKAWKACGSPGAEHLRKSVLASFPDTLEPAVAMMVRPVRRPTEAQPQWCGRGGEAQDCVSRPFTATRAHLLAFQTGAPTRTAQSPAGQVPDPPLPRQGWRPLVDRQWLPESCAERGTREKARSDSATTSATGEGIGKRGPTQPVCSGPAEAWGPWLRLPPPPSL